MGRSVAFVTGASRGIGKACSIHLARAGFSVAVTARTVHEGEAREHSSTVKASNTAPLPGSLAATVAAIEQAGGEALAVPADLLDQQSLRAAVAAVEERWGGVDVLVNNGRYIGPGHMDRILDTPLELYDVHLQANVIAPILLCQLVLPGMIRRGRGTIVDITSAAGYADPTRPAGEGGWGLGYGMSKAAMHRIAGILDIEHRADGVRAFNVQPGYITTERILADMGDFGFGDVGASPDVIGAVVAWLATSPDADEYRGRTVEGQYVCHERGLLPGWSGPRPNTAAIRYDTCAAELAAREAELAARHDG